MNKIDRGMRKANSVNFTENWVETIRERVNACDEPQRYNAVVFVTNPHTYDVLCKISSALDASIGGHCGDCLLLRGGGRVMIDVAMLSGSATPEDRVIRNYCGTQLTDIFILDETFNEFQFSYMLTRLRSKCNLTGKMWFGEEERRDG